MEELNFDILENKGPQNPIFEKKNKGTELDDSSFINPKIIGYPNFINDITTSATTCDSYMIIKANGKRYKVPLTAL